MGSQSSATALAAPGALRLPGDEIHVWHGVAAPSAPAPPGPDPQDLAALCAAERGRCLSLVGDETRRRYAAVHARVRGVLAGYLGVAPEAIRFGRAPCCRCGDRRHSPPCVDWPRTELRFGLSASGDHWLLAVARGRRIGADIEAAAKIDTALMSRACLTPGEQAYLATRDAAQRPGVLYRCWTRKEAVLKACGVGLASSPRALEVSPRRRGVIEVEFPCPAGPGRWAVHDLDAAPGTPRAWWAALAQPAAGAGRIVLREA